MNKKDFIADFVAFVLTVIAAVLFQWETRDIIWALWISSLTVGYAHIVITIIGGVCHVEGWKRFFAFFGGLFLLAFFTVHFGMFHFVHSVFLSVFFPLEGAAPEPNPLNFPRTIFLALSLYWPFVLTTFLSRFQDLRLATTGTGWADGRGFSAPYVNVVRMHLLIFVFAGLTAAKLTHYAIFPVLAFYFFPWGRFFKARREQTSDNPENASA